MPKQLFSNNASGVLTAAMATGSATVYVSGASLFPSPTAGDWALATITEGSDMEIVRYSTRGSTFLGSLVRAQEGTTAFAFTTAATIECRNTAGSMEQLQIDLETEVTTLNASVSATAPSISRTTTGFIGAGKAAVALADGTISGLEPDIAQGTKSTLASVGSGEALTAFDPVSGKILLYDAGTSVIHTGTITGSTIAWSAGVAAQSIETPTSFSVANGKILLSGHDSMYSGSGYIQVGTLAAGIPTMGTALQVTGPGLESDISSDGLLIDDAYNVYDNLNGYIEGFCATWSGVNLVVTAGISGIYNNAGQVVDLGGVYTIDYNLTGTTPSHSSVVGTDPRGVDLFMSFNLTHSVQVTASLALIRGINAVHHNDYSTGNQTITAGVSGESYLSGGPLSGANLCVISTSTNIYIYNISTSVVVASVVASNRRVAFDPANSRILSMYMVGSTLNIDTLNETTLVNEGSIATSIGDVTLLMEPLGDLAANDFVLVPYLDNLASLNTMEFVVVEPGVVGATVRTDFNFLGFAQTSTDGGSTLIDVVGGVNNSQSGLTSGLEYFVADDGVVSTTTSTSPAGLALSATEILIK